MDDSILSSSISHANAIVFEESDIIEFFQERAIEPKTWIRECIRYYKEHHRVPRPSTPVPEDPPPRQTFTITQEEACALVRENRMFQTKRMQIITMLEDMQLSAVQELCDRHNDDSSFFRCDVCDMPFHSKRSVALHKRRCLPVNHVPVPENVFETIHSPDLTADSEL